MRLAPALAPLALCASASLVTPEALAAPAIRWEPWSVEVFDRARAEGRFVLLDLGAVWCHWCHVMDEITYRDPEVIALIEARYLAVRVDQDAAPELAHRYEDYGWPATIVFGADGTEIARRRGYLNPSKMKAMLQAIIDDPSPGPSVTTLEEPRRDGGRPSLSAEARAAIDRRFRDTYDRGHAGWGSVHRYLHTDNTEYALARAAAGDEEAAAMVQATLAANLRLIDPVWGGVYQYSDLRKADDPWGSPHYEKIMWCQSHDLPLYVRAYVMWKKDEHLAAARAIDRYLERFLTAPDGAFYTSQDADPPPGIDADRYFALGDTERRRHGVPRVDRNVYPRENGWAIRALAILADATGDDRVLSRALVAAERMRALHDPRGGFRRAGATRPFLGDTLAMAEAMLALHASTADPRWLEEAVRATRFIEDTFRDPRGGYVTAPVEPGAPGVLARPVRQLDENTTLARFANLLARYTGRAEHRAIAEHAFAYIASPEVGRRRRTLTAVVLAAEELDRDPQHIVVSGRRDDPAAARLHAAARAVREPYARLEWWDGTTTQGSRASYPRLAKAAAFLCARGVCSRPAFEPDELVAAARSLRFPRAPSMLVE